MSKREMIQDEVAVGVSGGKLEMKDIEKMLNFETKKIQLGFSKSFNQLAQVVAETAKMKGQIVSTDEPDVKAGDNAGSANIVGCACFFPVE